MAVAAAVTLPPWLHFPTQLFNDSFKRWQQLGCVVHFSFSMEPVPVPMWSYCLELEVPLYSLSFYSVKLRSLPQISLLKQCASKSPAWDLCGYVGGKGNGGFRIIWLASFLWNLLWACFQSFSLGLEGLIWKGSLWLLGRYHCKRQNCRNWLSGSMLGMGLHPKQH